MVICQFTNLYSKNGSKNPSRKKVGEVIAMCDRCDIKFQEKNTYFYKLENIHKKHYCKKCRRWSAATMGGKASANSPNSGRFTTERGNKLTKKEQLHQVTKANGALQEKLKDPVYRREYFAKIFKNSRIGYISAGQKQVLNLLKKQCKGFILDGVVDNMKVDILNKQKKIAIEYNGDFGHCNPRKGSPDDYNKAIKMTAQEKWNKDRNRRFTLERMGYKVFIIGESGGYKDKEKYIKRILEYYEIC